MNMFSNILKHKGSTYVNIAFAIPCRAHAATQICIYFCEHHWLGVYRYNSRNTYQERPPEVLQCVTWIKEHPVGTWQIIGHIVLMCAEENTDNWTSGVVCFRRRLHNSFYKNGLRIRWALERQKQLVWVNVLNSSDIWFTMLLNLLIAVWKTGNASFLYESDFKGWRGGINLSNIEKCTNIFTA